MSLNQQINSSLVIKQQQQGGTSPLPNGGLRLDPNSNIMYVVFTAAVAWGGTYVFAGDIELNSKPAWCD
jgi:hypothetical protein